VKTCWKCEKAKSEEEFVWRDEAAGVRDGRCRFCASTASKRWYQENRARRLQASAAYQSLQSTKDAREARKNELYEIVNRLKSRPCADCGGSFSPWVMEFDHREPALKRREISYMVPRLYKLEVILKEIEKCDLVCSNCHADRTHKRRMHP
jgi:hypothetical protein